jgi:hypothetical protein
MSRCAEAVSNQARRAEGLLHGVTCGGVGRRSSTWTVLFLLFLHFIFWVSQRSAHATVPSEVAAHLGNDRACHGLDTCRIRTWDCWLSGRCTTFGPPLLQLLLTPRGWQGAQARDVLPYDGLGWRPSTVSIVKTKTSKKSCQKNG